MTRFSIFIRLFLSVIVFGAQSLCAAVNDQNAISEVLKSSKPAGVCLVEEQGGAATQAKKAEMSAPDYSCSISANKAVLLSQRPEALVADLRQATEFSQYFITGAVSVSGSELRSKKIFHKSEILLIGNGRGDREIYSTCALLKQGGVKVVRVVRGGYPAWIGERGPVLGNPGAIGEMVRLSAAELEVEAAFSMNTLLIAPSLKGMTKQIPTGVVLSDTTIDAIEKAVRASMAKRRSDYKDVGSVILMLDKNTTSEAINSIVTKLRPTPTLVYVDGAEVYKQFLHGQALMLKAQAAGPKKPKCAS